MYMNCIHHEAKYIHSLYLALMGSGINDIFTFIYSSFWLTLLEQQRLNDRINLLAHILQYGRLAELHSILQVLGEVFVCQLENIRVVGLLHVLHPSVSLTLRVDHERESTSFAEEASR